MDIPVLVQSLKSSILSLNRSQLDNTFWGVGSAAVKQLRCKTNIVAWGHGKFGPVADPRTPSTGGINIIELSFEHYGEYFRQ